MDNNHQPHLSIYFYKIRIILKSLLKDKKYFIFNLTGLVVFFLTTNFILSFIFYEDNFDKFNYKYDNIYRIISTNKKSETKLSGSPFLIKDIIKSNFNEEVKASRIKQLFDVTLKINNQYSAGKDFFCADTGLLNIFTFENLQYRKASDLISPNLILISESFAGINNVHPGDIIEVQNQKFSRPLKVSGIFKDFPGNSSIRPNCITSTDLAIKYLYGDSADAQEQDVNSAYFTTFIYLPGKTDEDKFVQSLNNLINSLYSDNPFEYSLQPMSEIHFHSSDIMGNICISGDITSYSILLLMEGLFLIAIIANFLIFTLLRIYKTGKSLVIKYMYGGNRLEIISNIFIEITFIILSAIIIAFIIFYFFSDRLFVEINLGITSSQMFSLEYISIIAVILLMMNVIILTFLSMSLRGKPIITLMQMGSSAKKNIFSFRNITLLLESVVFVIIIAALSTMYKQITYLEDQTLGYDYKNIIVVSLNETNKTSYNYIKNYMSGLPEVEKVTGAIFVPPNNSSLTIGVPMADDIHKKKKVEVVYVDYGFLETLNIKLIQGRYFSEDHNSDKHNALIINKTCMEELKIENPIGYKINDREIIGVADDFYFHSFYKELTPMLFELDEEMLYEVVLKSSNPLNTVKSIKDFSTQYSSNFSVVLDFRFMEDDINRLYGKEKLILKFVLIISVFITLFLVYGYFAYSIYDIRLKLKSITIRKVFGASNNDLYKIVLANYLLIYITSLVLALPPVEYLSGIWLSNFAYKISFGITDYLLLTLAGVSIIFISIIGNIKSAIIMNPSVVLRQYSKE